MANDLAGIINVLFTVLTFAIIGRALLSWFDPRFNSPIGKIIYDITEPIVGPIRRVVPSAGMFDFSPIIAIILLQVLNQLIGNALA